MEIKYNRDNKSFLIYDEPEIETAIIKFPFEDHYKAHNFEDEDVNNYTFTEYYRKDVKESDCCTLFVHDDTSPENHKRIGWIIPLSVMVTEDAETLANPHLSCYVFLTYMHLLNKDEFCEVEDYNSFADCINASQNQDKCIVIINNAQYGPNDLPRLELSFALNGFYQKSLNYINAAIVLPENRNLKLSPTKDIIKADGTYIESFFRDFLDKYIAEKYPIIKFMFLYQIMEILFNSVLVEKLKALLKDVEEDNGSIRELSDEFKGQTEFARWQLIEKRAGIENVKYEELDAKCNAFLYRSVNLLSHPNSIYQVRNHITHRFRKTITNTESIKEINQYFELYLLDLLINYKQA